MIDVIIIVILALVLLIALKESIKHFKGQGSCCGGGSTVKTKRKKLKGAVVCELLVTIEGMHCEKCSNRIEEKINDLDGVNCKVNLKKKEAVIASVHEIDESKIRKIIEDLGYKILEAKIL